MSGRRVLVLGAGIGGVAAASLLRRSLEPEDRVTMVDARTHHEFRPALLRVAVGAAGRVDVRRSLDELSAAGVDVVCGTVHAIDAARREVDWGGGRRRADAVVVALGAAMDASGLPGLSDAAPNPYTLQGAEAVADGLRRITRGTVAIVVSGPCTCPVAPYELAMLADDALRRRAVRDHVAIAVHAATAGPFTAAGPTCDAAVAGWLAQRGIDHFPNRTLRSVDRDGHRLEFADGSRAPYDLLIAVPPHVAPKAVGESDLAGPDGWAPVEARTSETAHPNVFVIGDAAAVALPSGGELPKLGVFAHAQARAVARTITARLRGRGDEGRFDGEGESFVETGSGMAGLVCAHYFAAPGPLALAMHPTPHWHAAHAAVASGWWRTWFQ